MFERYVEMLEKVILPSELTEVLDQLTISANFHQYRLALVLPTTHITRKKAVIYSNCSPLWIERYTSHKYASHDPILFLAKRQTLPITWDKLPPLSTLPPGAAHVMTEAKKFGLHNGISFPLRGSRGAFGVFSFITDNPITQVDRHTPHLGYVANYAFAAAIRIYCNNKTAQLKKLTERESSCLLWAAEGKTLCEIATILSIKERTVRFHLDSVTKKLGASNRMHAMMIASIADLIHPEMIFIDIEEKLSPLMKPPISKNAAFL